MPRTFLVHLNSSLVWCIDKFLDGLQNYFFFKLFSSNYFFKQYYFEFDKWKKYLCLNLILKCKQLISKFLFVYSSFLLLFYSSSSLISQIFCLDLWSCDRYQYVHALHTNTKQWKGNRLSYWVWVCSGNVVILKRNTISTRNPE